MVPKRCVLCLIVTHALLILNLLATKVVVLQLLHLLGQPVLLRSILLLIFVANEACQVLHQQFHKHPEQLRNI